MTSPRQGVPLFRHERRRSTLIIKLDGPVEAAQTDYGTDTPALVSIFHEGAGKYRGKSNTWTLEEQLIDTLRLLPSVEASGFEINWTTTGTIEPKMAVRRLNYRGRLLD